MTPGRSMNQDPYRYFRIEASELLEQLGRGVLELERPPFPADLVPKLLRFAHTLKGAARVVKQVEIAELVHEIEDVLATLREGSIPLLHEPATALLEKVDAIGARVSSLAVAVQAPSVGAGAVRAEEALPAIRADVGEMDSVLDGLAEVSTNLAALRVRAGRFGRVRHLADSLIEQLSTPRLGTSSPGAKGTTAGAERLAVELRSIVIALERSLGASIDELDRELRQVQDAGERLRLVSARALFGPLERAARDAAVAARKDVGFEAHGGDVRLDANVLAGVQPALIQLVRNAVAHGIGSPTERVAAGKLPQGSVIVEVVRRGDRIVFRCRDDGRGVDLEAVRRVAGQRGLLSAQDAARASPEELIALLLRGGLSTSTSVTEIAGRGVGLDVVREATRKLGGEVIIRTQRGEGTVVELVVPVSMASMEILLVETGDTCAAIPLDGVRRVLHVGPTAVVRSAEGDTLLHEGALVRFVPLAQILRLRAPAASRLESAVLVDSGSGLAALGVERVRGVRSSILRPLPRLAPADPIVLGVSLDSQDGPQMVLDAQALVAAALDASAPAPLPPETKTPILVIDDSLTTRMLVQSILESAGYEVELAKSGEEGFEKALARRYAVMLVDVEMPGMNGFEFVERTRAHSALRSVPTVLVTSRGSPEDRKRGADAGCAAYIVKGDFDQRELLETIRRLIGGR